MTLMLPMTSIRFAPARFLLGAPVVRVPTRAAQENPHARVDVACSGTTNGFERFCRGEIGRDASWTIVLTAARGSGC